MEKHPDMATRSVLAVLTLLLTACQVANLCPAKCHCNEISEFNINSNCSWAALHTVPREDVDVNTTDFIATHNILKSLGNTTFVAFCLQPLTTIILDHNSISEIESGTFKCLKNLKRLSISHNKIEDLHRDTFAQLSKLQDINLSENNLISPHLELFVQNHNLMILNIALNNIRFLPSDLFKNNNHLTEIHINDNELTSLSNNQFKYNPELKIINIENNNILFVEPDTFSFNQQLSYVNLSGNKISHLENDTFKNNNYIESIDLSNNGLQTLPACQIQCFRKVKIYISGNPLVCSGHLQKVLKFCRDGNVHFVGTCDSRTSSRRLRIQRDAQSSYPDTTVDTSSELLHTLPFPSAISLTRYNHEGSSTEMSPVGNNETFQESEYTNSNNDSSVSEGNMNVYTTDFSDYNETVSTEDELDQNVTTLVTFVEYDSPLVLRESTARGCLFIGIECSLASMIVLRKVCSRDKRDRAIVDSIELLPEPKPKTEENNDTEDGTVQIQSV